MATLEVRPASVDHNFIVFKDSRTRTNPQYLRLEPRPVCKKPQKVQKLESVSVSS